MNEITNELLLKDLHATKTIVMFSLFAIAGLAVLFVPFLYCSTPKKLLINMAAMLVIAIPFIWIGTAKIVKTAKMASGLKNAEYRVVVDSVCGKRMLQDGTSSDSSNDYCLLSMEEYSEKTGKAIPVTRQVFNQTKVGDKLYLIYLEGKMICWYPCSSYVYKG